MLLVSISVSTSAPESMASVSLLALLLASLEWQADKNRNDTSHKVMYMCFFIVVIILTITKITFNIKQEKTFGQKQTFASLFCFVAGAYSKSIIYHSGEILLHLGFHYQFHAVLHRWQFAHQIGAQHRILTKIIHRNHSMPVKLEHIIALHDLVERVVIVHCIFVGLIVGEHIMAKGNVGFVIVEITQHTRHDVGLADYLVFHPFQIPAWLIEQNRNGIQFFVSPVLIVGHLVGMVCSYHKQCILVPRHA